MSDPNPKQYGKWCRNTFVKHLGKEWGELNLREPWIFCADNRKILVRVSKFHEEYYRYFYDVYQSDWGKWDNHSYLALLMHDGEQVNYAILNPKESQHLLNMINPASDGSKNINIYMPTSGKLYIQAWQEFPFLSKVVNIGPIMKSDFTQLPPNLLALIRKMSPEKIAELIAKLS